MVPTLLLHFAARKVNIDREIVATCNTQPRMGGRVHSTIYLALLE